MNIDTLNNTGKIRRLGRFLSTCRRFGFLAARFAGAVGNFGLFNALQFYLYCVTRRSQASIMAKALDARIYFRGKDDYYVLTLLFERNFHIYSESTELRTALDLGANIGVESLRLSRLHPSLKILAVEADPENFALLKKNTQQCERIQAINAAAWGVPARFRIRRNSQCNMASTVEMDPLGEIPGMTVVQLIDQLGTDTVDIMKIDIEGAEASIFKDSIDEWISRVKVLVWELNDHEAPEALSCLTSAAIRNGAKFNFHISGEKLIAIRTDTDIKVDGLCGVLIEQ